MTTKAQGIDISRYDISFDPQKATKQIDFVIIKASEGTYWYDPAYPKMMDGVRQIPIRGAYHYFRNPGSDYQKQADWFLKRVEEKADDFQFYALDFESTNNNLSVEMSMWANKWMLYVQRKTNKEVIFYTNRNLYDLYGYHYCSQWPLWLAWYRLWPWVSPDKPIVLPKKRKAGNWILWQYACERNQPFGFNPSKSYGGGANKIDLNVFNGTVEKMHDWLKVGKIVVPPIVDFRTAQVIVGSLRVRTGPGVQYGIVKGLLRGDRVKVYEVKEIRADEKWARLEDNNWAALMYGGMAMMKIVKRDFE